MSLRDADLDMAITRAIMTVHTGPFQKIEDISAATLWTWYRAIYRAGYRLALEDAARECEQRWRDGYRGEVNVGFAHVIRALAEEIDK